MNRFWTLCLILVFFSTFSGVSQVYAKRSKKPTKKVIRYKKHTRIKLDESLIEGEQLDPARIEVTLSPRRKFKGFLKPRTDFLKELRQDVRQVR